MAIDFSLMVYLPAQATFGRSIQVYPIKSQPGVAPYFARGIYETRGTVIQTEAGLVVMSDQETILDIREIEFAVAPVQGDLVDIPAEASIPAAGMFEITDAAWNGGGEVTLTIREYEPPSETFVPPGVVR
jgi:hypothetical protein